VQWTAAVGTKGVIQHHLQFCNEEKDWENTIGQIVHGFRQKVIVDLSRVKFEIYFIVELIGLDDRLID
jgi:hypothetical protein